MAVKHSDAEDEAFERAGANINDISLQDEVSKSFLEYSYSVITSRALPDARDGLKPVHRRILYSMADAGLRPDHAYVKSARVVGSCFAAGTLVHTPAGLKPIEDFKVGDEIYTPEGETTLVDKLFKFENSKMLRIHYADGSYQDVTEDQKMEVVNHDYTTEWVEANNINNRVVISGKKPTNIEFVKPETDEAINAYIFGLFIAEGSRGSISGKDGRSSIQMVDRECIEYVTTYMEKTGIYTTGVNEVEPSTPNYKTIYKTRVSRNDSLTLATAETASNKTIPTSILQQVDLYAPLLAGLWDGDGSLRGNKRHAVYTTVSRKLANQIYSMLARLGIRANISTYDTSNNKPSFINGRLVKSNYPLIQLNVSGNEAVKLSTILKPYLVSERKTSAAKEISETKVEYLPSQYSMIPSGHIFDEFSEKHLGGGWFKDINTGKKFRMALDTKGKIRYGKSEGVNLNERSLDITKAIEKGWLEKLERIGSKLVGNLEYLSNRFFIPVVKVEKLPNSTSYDIRVEHDRHAFIAEGKTVSNCMGSLHPHGDSAIYEALVRLAQPFSQNTILVDGNGNFGSPNDSAAASRYTECRLAPAAMLLVSELDEGTVNWKPNYDGSLEEPTVLPAAYPNLLVNGGTGIAVGMATNMIPHNLNEAINAARLILKKPEATLDELMEIIPGPDLPTAGLILGVDEVRKAYEEGKGSIRIRAKVEVIPLEGTRGRSSLVATELPYGIGSERIIEKIKEEILKKRLQGISDVKDLSDRRNGTRLVIECKTGVNPQILLNELYRLTPLEVSFGISNLALVDGQPRTLGLKEMLTVFIDHRLEVVTRRTQYRLDKALARKHIVEGLLIALDNIDNVVKIIRASKDTAEARTNLMAKFKLSEIQTGYILEMPLRRLVSLEVESLRKELIELQKAIEGYQKILNDEKELRKVVDKELAEVNEKIVTPRQTKLIGGDLKEVLAEAAAMSAPLEVEDEICKVLFSRTGLLARTPVKSEQSTEMRAKSGRSKHDAVHSVITTSTRSKILAITSLGRAFKIDVLALPSLPLVLSGNVNVSGGMPFREVAALDKNETIVGIAPLDSENLYGIAMGTKQGIVKIGSPDWPTRGEEFQIMGLKDGDEIVSAFALTDDSGELTFISSDSSLLHFPVKSVRPQGRTGGGMAGIKLAADTHVVAFAVAKDATFSGETFEPIVTTWSGFSVKLTPLSAYPGKGRGTGGVRSHRFLKGEDHLETAWISPRPVASTDKGEPIDLPEIDMRRDGSGTPLENIGFIGGQQSRTNPPSK